MNVPSKSENGETHVISNLQYSQRSPRQTTSSIDIENGTTNILEAPTNSSFSERIGSFVDTCSRTSLMYMAENVSVAGSSDRNYLVDTSIGDRVSIGSSSSYKRNSMGAIQDERTSLLRDHPPLTKLTSNQSRTSTIADTYQDSSQQQQQQQLRLKSNFMQSVFNSINILCGIGVLALPLGFKHAGWILGMVTFAFCLGLTNYTAKLLGRCLQAYPDSFTYGDIAYNAFGNRGRIVVSVLFLTELITCSVALVVLLNDGLDSLFPGMHSVMTLISYTILTPMLFFPVRHLSYTSLIGILSAVFIIIVIIADGFTKSTSPGSLIDSADTTWWPAHWMALPRSTGLIMSGFCGHTCFGTIYHDMQYPKQYTRMVDWTYMVSGLIYLTVAVAGYRMFGSDTLQEITQNLMLVPEYNQTLNRMVVWLIALNPIAKYSLTMSPVNLSWELALERQSSIEAWCNKQPWSGRAIHIIGKCLVSALIVILAYCWPQFDRIMSLLGACFSFIISGMFPIVCYQALFGPTLSLSEKWILRVLFFLCFVLAVVGTLWSFV